MREEGEREGREEGEYRERKTRKGKIHKRPLVNRGIETGAKGSRARGTRAFLRTSLMLRRDKQTQPGIIDEEDAEKASKTKEYRQMNRDEVVGRVS